MLSSTWQNILSSILLIISVLLPTHARNSPELQDSGDITQLNSGFPVTRIYVVLTEELPPGSLVLDLNSNPLVKNIQSAFENGATLMSFQYRLMNTFDSRLFRVGTNSGRMTVATRLDREWLCASQKAQFCCNARATLPSGLMSDPKWKEETNPLAKGQQCHLVAHISIQSTALRSGETENNPSSSQMALIYVYIRLDDINDHTPQFTTQSNSLNVAEDTAVGTVLQYFPVSDPDAGINGLSNVKLDVTPLTIGDPKTIHINSMSRSLLENSPFEAKLSRDGVSLQLSHTLDREIVAAYDVVLTVIDGDRLKPRSSQLNLRIHVTDANDNAPVWIKQSEQNVSPAGDHFLPITLNSFDNSQPTRFNVTVPEDTQVGALVFWFQAQDADVGDNARLQYAIDTSAPGGIAALDYFSVQSTTGEVRLRTQLDYDSASLQLSRPEIEVPVIVRDTPRNGRQLSAKATLTVRIVDVNDMYPIITASPLQPISIQNHYPGSMLGDGQTQTTFGVWENRPPGQPIASILVNDPDTGDGGKVSCSIQSDFFILASESGKSDYYNNYQPQNFLDAKNSETEASTSNPSPMTYHLLSNQRLDRESIPKHQVVFTCRDHDRSRPLVSSQRLDIEVLDENDNAPEFSSSPIVLTCPENSPPGQVIGRLNATDKDIGENARLRFWVDERDTSWVGVQAQTGEVRVNTVFDRETETDREFVVYVADSDGASGHTVSTTVKIRVLDENDHAPHFTDLYFFSLPENSPPGTEVGHVRAEDEDEGKNGKIRYLLHPPSRDFELDRDTGMLTVRASGFDGIRSMTTDPGKLRVSFLDREQQDTYELTVIAEDGGNPPRRATTVVHIGLSDVNDHAPQFRYPTPHGPGSTLNVSCAQLSSQLIARVHANDSDSGRNGEVEYSIVRDGTYPSRRTRDVAIADLVNATTTPPELNPNSTLNETRRTSSVHNKTPDVELQTNENVTNTRHVKSASTMDPLLGGPTANHFEINSYNGQLFLIHPIMDCSQPADIRLVIRAKDGGDPPLSSTAILTIHVRPTEDPIGHVGLTSSNGYRRNAQSGSVKNAGNSWINQMNLGKRAQRKSSSASSTGSVTQFLSNSSHWSAIVGLIVAMVILVLLLCIMLFVLRRKFIGEEHKVVRKNPGPRQAPEKNTSTSMRLMNDTREIYYKGESINDMGTNSSQPNSMSPTALAHLEDLNCSSMSLVPSQPGMMSAHYFCTVPSSATAVTLNTGEIAVLHHENEGRIMPDKPSSSKQMIYKTSNGDLYGYVETQPRKNLHNPGHTYQTLQPRQTNVRKTSIYAPEAAKTCRTNSGCFERNVLSDRSSCAQNGQYTPLLKHTTNAKLSTMRYLQASQPDLTENKSNNNREEDRDAACKSMLIHCDRALSLSDLTPQTVQLLPFPTEEHWITEKPSTQPITTVPLSKRQTHRPGGARCKRTMKTLAVELERTGSTIASPYNSASFV